MSGGHFEYKQRHITDIVESIQQQIHDEKSGNKSYSRLGLSKTTIEEFERGITLLKKAAIYAQRIDWLISGDDSEDTFHERLKEELL